jgi:hypothetical protein
MRCICYYCIHIEPFFEKSDRESDFSKLVLCFVKKELCHEIRVLALFSLHGIVKAWPHLVFELDKFSSISYNNKCKNKKKKNQLFLYGPNLCTGWVSEAAERVVGILAAGYQQRNWVPPLHKVWQEFWLPLTSRETGYLHCMVWQEFDCRVPAEKLGTSTA